MTKVLILGGAGFLGVNMTHFCLEKGAEVVVVDPFIQKGDWARRKWLEGTTIVLEHLGLYAYHYDVLTKFDYIFNCAGQSSHPLSMRKPLYDLEYNCRDTLMFLEAMRTSGSKAALVYAGSSTVIGQAVRPIVDEAHQERPRDIYSADKGVAEKYHLIYRETHGLRTVPLRFTNLYGPYGKASPDFGFINYFISLAAEGKPITVYGSGHQTRNVLYVEDACRAMWTAAQAVDILDDGPYFVGGRTSWSVMQVALSIADVYGGQVKTMDWPEERVNIEIGDVQISSDKFKFCTGWDQQYALKAGLEKTKEVTEG
jgi:nucleoside-diphosphate-sugar epimerase